jgi:PAS domain S-box-containing protein
MKVSKHNLQYRILIVTAIFLVIILAGIWFVIRNISQEMLFRQVSAIITMAVIWTVALYALYRYFSSKILKPIQQVGSALRSAADGDLSARTDIEDDGEIGAISDDVNNIIRNQVELADFLEKIGDGNLNIEYKIRGEHDKLGYSVVGMRDKLKKLALEDANRQWVTEGIAKFGAVLRDNIDDLKVLSDKLLADLVKYLAANQGAIFLMSDNDKNALEMVSVYAWERKKHTTATIQVGEGLIGQAAIEKATVYITDVPDNFIRITSGLGDANPRSVLIVPMIFNDELFGVMEFASFRTYQQFEINFVEQLAEIIATTLSRANTSKQTQKLLRDSQKLTEELRTQEEEMRQHIEEMNATQEEMQLREVERIGIFTAINNTIATVEFSMDGRITNANEKFLSMMNYSMEEIEHKTDRTFADKSNEPIEMYNKFWAELQEGKMRRGDFKRLTKDGRDIWINASYTPALDKNGKPYKVIQLAQDITEKKKAELELQRQAEELRSQGEKLKTYTSELEDIKQNLSEKLNEASKGLLKKINDIEYEKAKNVAVLEGCVDGVISFNQEGIIEYFNHAAEEIWSIQRENVIGKNIKTLMPVEIAAKDNGISAFYSNNGASKEIDVRTEISFNDSGGNSIDLLATLTKAKVGEETTFTIFSQKISVDLF